MKVDYVLILAAGKGTRMGPVGKVVPKVLWPIFNKSILELEVLYAKEFNPQKIFINSYYYNNELKEHFDLKLSNYSDVELVIEKEVLDIGGAVHNVAQKLGYDGRLLIINSDQFIYLNKEQRIKLLDTSTESDITLCSNYFSSSEKYNALNIKEGRVTDIINNADLLDHHERITYTGMSIVNLKCLKKVNGISKFFDSVANFQDYCVKAYDVSPFEYWDFGTLQRYINSICAICNKKDSEFLDFLKRNNCYITGKKNGTIQIDNRFSINSNDQLIFSA